MTMPKTKTMSEDRSEAMGDTVEGSSNKLLQQYLLLLDSDTDLLVW
jgi:hypothetical protein